MRSQSSYVSQQQDIKADDDKKQVTIVLERQLEGEREDPENWPLMFKSLIEKDINGSLKLNDIIIKLRKQNFHHYFDSSLSYYNEQRKMYIFCFFVPMNISQKELLKDRKYQRTIPIEALEEKKGEVYCKLKFRKKCKNKLQLLKEEQKNKFGEQYDKKGSKQKQKSIAEVIEKVALWRKLYTGFPDEKDQNVHFELEQAAGQVGVIKKTLDDYLLQIRNGKRYGFNFNKRKNQKIGQLRGFVKDKRASKK